MQQEIKEFVSIVSQEVEALIPLSFENNYYGKMFYSNKNKVLESDVSLLKKTISFEVAFVHVTLHLVCKTCRGIDFETMLKMVDKEGFYSWYRIRNSIVLEGINNTDITFSEIYQLINEHDTLIDKDIKKKLGQFYTPVGIVKKMIKELKSDFKSLDENASIIDPACGTGVFIVETIKLLKQWLTIDNLVAYVNNVVYAYDVNPFAVVVTRINIINVLFELGYKNDDFIWKRIELDNIKLKNTISEIEEKQFNIVLGNPPYFKLDNDALKEITGYEEVLYGQPNIYSLFIHWAIKHLVPNGIVSFIVPQSLRSGLYFKKIREQLKELRIKSILHIDSRQNIFDRAEQAVLIICLQNSKPRNTKTKIQFATGEQKIVSEFSVERRRLMLGQENNYMFVINRKPEMYDILDKIQSNSIRLADKQKLKFSNGLFVWNQQKNMLCDSDEKGIPVIYGASVQPVQFNYIESWPQSDRKAFAQITTKTEPYVLAGKRLLIQRTTNFEKDIRLKSCLISDNFLEKYDNYFLENHINFLSGSDKSELLPPEVLYFYLGLLNSKLLNYIFVSTSGNTQVSANELNMLPFPNKCFEEISYFVSKHVDNLSNHQEQLDNLVFRAYDLSQREIDFIKEQ
ncbi:MAG: N-6 DNA methylase [Oscillospiraceae bacterium]|nr:N-6 DNA methylase [Oscillospiraceae bacterium]